MISYGKSTVSHFLGDRIVFRSLTPCDSRIPGLADLREKLKFPKDFLPRKSMPEYGKIIAEMVSSAHENLFPGSPLSRIIYIGDTRMNDGQAFVNICKASNWPGVAFIGADQSGPLEVKMEDTGSGKIYSATRWKALEQFESYLADNGFPVDEETAVLFDLDKTILGARGRNDKILDTIRLKAAEETLSNALGDEFSSSVFQNAYKTFNQVAFHPFTADNQDYLVYICLMISSGFISQSDLVQMVSQKHMPDFSDFLTYVNEKRTLLPKKVCDIHQNAYARFQMGDPTPFKSFRANEYKHMAQHMGNLPETAPIEQILTSEIAITGEIHNLARRWERQGILLFGLSDKPDEAILPSAILKAQGYLPVHHMMTHVIGEE